MRSKRLSTVFWTDHGPGRNAGTWPLPDNKVRAMAIGYGISPLRSYAFKRLFTPVGRSPMMAPTFAYAGRVDRGATD
eukprot:8228755-Pyramimonas_sp.AAC.1